MTLRKPLLKLNIALHIELSVLTPEYSVHILGRVEISCTKNRGIYGHPEPSK